MTAALSMRFRAGRLCLLVPMHGLAALLFPAVLMLFAMGMDKVQSRIDRSAVSRDEVEDFLDSADAQNVQTWEKGWSRPHRRAHAQPTVR